jgi:L-threonylcarbamoyladenylate synthase
MGRIGDISESMVRGGVWRDKISQGLARGGVVIYPTDTLYALGASARSEQGVRRVADLKGRPPGMPVSFAFASLDDILAWADASPTAISVMEKNFPGPLTVVVPASAKAPRWAVNSDGTLGARIPDQATVRMLIADAGPLTATSANLHGGPDPRRADEVPDELAGKADYVLNFGPCKHAKGSTIIKIIGDGITLLREGVVPLRELKR